MNQTIPRFNCRQDENWLRLTANALRTEGYAVVDGVLSEQEQCMYRDALYSGAAKIKDDIGEQRLKEASELAVLRFPMRYEKAFFKVLENQELLDVVDEYLSPSAVMRFQVGVILPGRLEQQLTDLRWQDYHVNFPHAGRISGLAMDCALYMSDMTEASGGVEVFPGSHVHCKSGIDDIAEPPVLVTVSAGSMLVIDGAVWHREQANKSDEDKLYLTHQFSLPIMKQQFDYCKGLGDQTVLALPERTRRLLGWEARVPASLQEFYLPRDQRLYKA